MKPKKSFETLVSEDSFNLIKKPSEIVATEENFNSKEQNDKLNHKVKSSWFDAFCERWFIKNIQIIFLVSITVILINTGLDISFGKAENSTWLRIATNILTFLVGFLIPKKPN
jgi:hypothetical protein